MKKFTCARCSKYLGEMTQGKIKKDVTILCTECISYYKTLESINDYKKGIDRNVGGDNKMQDLFKGIGLDNIFGKK